MIDPALQESIEAQLTTLLDELSTSMLEKDIELVRDLLTHGENGEALNILLWAHTENSTPMTTSQRDAMKRAADQMGVMGDLARYFDRVVTNDSSR